MLPEEWLLKLSFIESNFKATDYSPRKFSFYTGSDEVIDHFARLTDSSAAVSSSHRKNSDESALKDQLFLATP